MQQSPASEHQSASGEQKGKGKRLAGSSEMRQRTAVDITPYFLELLNTIRAREQPTPPENQQTKTPLTDKQQFKDSREHHGACDTGFDADATEPEQQDLTSRKTVRGNPLQIQNNPSRSQGALDDNLSEGRSQTTSEIHRSLQLIRHQRLKDERERRLQGRPPTPDAWERRPMTTTTDEWIEFWLDSVYREMEAEEEGRFVSAPDSNAVMSADRVEELQAKREVFLARTVLVWKPEDVTKWMNRRRKNPEPRAVGVRPGDQYYDASSSSEVDRKALEARRTSHQRRKRAVAKRKMKWSKDDEGRIYDPKKTENIASDVSDSSSDDY